MPTWPSFFHLAMPSVPPAIPTPEAYRASLSPEEDTMFAAEADALYAVLQAALAAHCQEHPTSAAACIHAAQRLADTLLAEVFADASDA